MGIFLVRANLKTVKEKHGKRQEFIDTYGYNSKERIILDQEIQHIGRETREQLEMLDAQLNRKRKKYAEEDLKQQTTTLRLLRENLEIMEEGVIRKEGSDGKNQNLFGNLRTDEEHDVGVRNKKIFGEESEQRELFEEEKEALEQFEKNDKEIDDMIDVVIGDITQLKVKADNLGMGI